MLRDMAEGDTSYLDRVIERFVIGSDTALVEIRAAVDRDDVAGLRQKAHRLAGTALNIGLVRVGETARELEHLADAGTTSGSDEVLPRLDGALVRGRQALVAYREQHSARHS
jgi:HPt (histidine-containing phosphotransfer) domain-containing protein